MQEAGIFTCSFFRYIDAVFKLLGGISLVYDIGLDLKLSEVSKKVNNEFAYHQKCLKAAAGIPVGLHFKAFFF